MVEGDGIKLFLRVDAREFYMDAPFIWTPPFAKINLPCFDEQE